MGKTVFVSGAAGFIGSHVVQSLLSRGDTVIGLDNFDGYYDPERKRANLAEVVQATHGLGCFRFHEGDIRDHEILSQLFSEEPFDALVHLAAMPGVRASVENPGLYIDVNLQGTLMLLEAAVGRLAGRSHSSTVANFVFASSSSVYGATGQLPSIETDPCDRPLAPYPASKRAAELLGYTYHSLYGLPFTALRLFTVYGPRNRPDMMAYRLVQHLHSGQEVPFHREGQMLRDWTYVDDIVRGIVIAIDRPLGYEILNLGRGEPVLLKDFVHLMEELTNRKARLVPVAMPTSDVPSAFAAIDKARHLLGWKPTISLRDGSQRFLDWYRKTTETGRDSDLVT